jgi:hypothetical protein
MMSRDVVNPLTGRRIRRGGPTHIRLLKEVDELLQIPEDMSIQQGGAIGKLVGKTAQGIAKGDSNFFTNLYNKAQSVNEIVPTSSGAVRDGDNIVVPKSKYHLASSRLPPAPEQHSWYHHHAPFSQNFGDYVCLKRSNLQQLGTFLRDAMFSDVESQT